MKIKYKHYKDGLTVGITDYTGDDIVPGYDNLLVLGVANIASKQECQKLMNDNKMVAYSKPHGTDKYDEKIGEEIVKNKLLIRDAERQILKISIIDKYLNKILKTIGKNSSKYVNRMNRSYARLEKFE